MLAEAFLIHIHLGPVQAFIATARRTRDLSFGSWLLGDLAKTVAREIVKRHGGDTSVLVFPAPATIRDFESDELNAPNKIVARITQDPKSLAQALRQALDERLIELWHEARQRVRGPIDDETTLAQITDFIEFYWAAVPLGDNYAQSRAYGDALLAARKMTRTFVQPTWGSHAQKCSLCGVRESVLSASFRYKDDPDKLFELYGTAPGEHLCGVDLLKRHGPRTDKTVFYSTSHIAGLSLLHRVAHDRNALEQARAAVARYCHKLTELGADDALLSTSPEADPVLGHMDGTFLYEERLRDLFNPRSNPDALSCARQALRAMINQAFQDKSPSPYYALLLADGDNMGVVINAQKDPDQHRQLSQSLGRFAVEATRIVKEHAGVVVYAGGDDVLALLPVHQVLLTARQLNSTFGEMMARYHVTDGEQAISPSLSVGVMVAHHLDPLSESLRALRNVERAAKGVKGKNALAVSLSKRSGSDVTVRGTWGAIDCRLFRLIELYRRDAIPYGLAHELGNMALHLKDVKPATLVTAEAVRILKRKRAEKGRTPVVQDVPRQIQQWLEDDRSNLTVLQLAQEMVVAHELAKAEDLAGLPVAEARGVSA